MIHKYSLVVFVKKREEYGQRGLNEGTSVQQPIEGVLLPKYRTIYH
jgi:hypothetical protein